MAESQVLREKRRSVARRTARQERYAEVLETHGAGLSRVVAAYADRAEDREDLRQEFALALWRALAQYREEASLKTFAYRIATNVAVSFLRRRRATEPVLEPHDGSPSAEEQLSEEGRRRRLRAAIDGLPLNLRQVVLLRLEELSYAEIGAVLGLTEKNVSVRLTRARARLREQMGDPA